MDVTQVKKDIQDEAFKDFYIFTGDEWQVQKTYINKIAEVSGKPKQYIDSIVDVLSKLNNKSFLSSNYCYIVRDDINLLKEDKLLSRLDNGLLGDNILILLLTAVDKRTKFYKRYKDKIVEFKYLSESILIKHIQKEIELSERNCKTLITLCESDYSRILLEIDKIKRINRYSYDKDFEDLMEEGAIAEPPYDAVFDFVEAVLRRNVNLSFNLLQQCYDVGEATLVMISNLFSNTKQLLQVQACEDRDVARVTGLNAWQIKNARERIGNYSIGELVYMLKLIQQVEKGIKTGTIEEGYAMQYILVNVL